MAESSGNSSIDYLVVEDKKQEEEADAVARRLRDKIRLQAESLLLKADAVSSSSVRNSQVGTPTNGISTPVNNNINEGTSTPSGLSTANNNNNNNISNTSSSGNELTKRLQKLAMDRASQLNEENSNQRRLRIVQSDASMSHLSSIKTFAELNLPDYLLKAIYNMGFDRPSAIQEAALPRILDNRNLMGQAQSGSGKTAAFTLGMLYRIDLSLHQVQALCVTPTRELAIQIVEKAVTPMAANMPGFKVQLAVSQSKLGVDNKKSLQAHVVVGTPGKICDWLKRRILCADLIKVLVLDEADHMVDGDGGHRANSLLIKQRMPKTVQTLLFSATFSENVVKFASKMVGPNCDKILIEDGPEYLVLDVIKQLWIDTRQYGGGGGSKLEFLADIYSLLTIGQSIVFVGRKTEADLVHKTLTDAGYTCSVLHGSVEPAERDATMEAFRNGQSNVLITTNVLARGVDVDNVCLVVNYDIPVTMNNDTGEEVPDFETYLHRIGRTGRFGRKGTAINLVGDQKSLELLAAIEAHFSRGNGVEMIQQAAPDPEALADIIEI